MDLQKCKTMNKNNGKCQEFKIDKKMQSKGTCPGFLRGFSDLSNYQKYQLNLGI